ncbi:MAG: peptidase MA family metallohydrolase [bacterium]
MDTQRTKGIILVAVNVIVVGLILFAVMNGPVGKPTTGSPPGESADGASESPAGEKAAAAGSHGGSSGKHGSKEKKVSSAAPAEAGAVAALGASAATGARAEGRTGGEGLSPAIETKAMSFSPAIVAGPAGGARAAADDSTLIGRNNAGVRFFTAGDYAAAQTEFEAAFAASPDDPVIRRNLACTLAQSAVALAQGSGSSADAAADAIALVERASSLLPKNPELLRLAGELHFRSGDNTRARHALEEAETVAPADAAVQRVLGEIAYREERLDEAIRRWKRAIELGEDDPRLAARVGKAERERGVEGDMDVVRDRHFVVKFAEGHTGAAGEAELALRALDRIRDRVGREVAWFPERPIAVILYSGEEFRAVTGAHAWMGGLFDGKIRIPIRGVDRIDENVEKLLAHEYAHALVAEKTGGGAPGWIDEGFAQWIAGEWSGRRAEEASARLAGGALIDFASLEGSFTRITDPALAEAAYFQAFLAVDYLMERYGADDLQRYLALIAKDTRPADALEQVYHLTYERLADGVAAHLADLHPTFSKR